MELVSWLDELVIRFSAFVRYLRKEYGYIGTVNQLFTDFFPESNTVGYNSPIEFWYTREARKAN
jgi:hypothetical protein